MKNAAAETLLLRRIVESLRRKDFQAHEVPLDQTQLVVLVLPLSTTADGRDESGFDRKWKDVFLEWLRRGVTVGKAAELAGVSRRHAYRCKGSDPSFREQWESVRNQRSRRR